ncbi:hypothetical protein PT974_10374 [Cladobotryum mycophilum]|uniref:Lysine-specific metallo-endopeptidase domain-containing protein n=1 Tax=Cladobotryum mycophilum TaxID=491253 RepID=A0ABR0SAK6_9HYPO
MLLKDFFSPSAGALALCLAALIPTVTPAPAVDLSYDTSPSNDQHVLFDTPDNEVIATGYLAQFSGQWTNSQEDKLMMNLLDKAYTNAILMADLAYDALDPSDPHRLFKVYFGVHDSKKREDLVRDVRSVFKNILTATEGNKGGVKRNLLHNLTFLKWIRNMYGDRCGDTTVAYVLPRTYENGTKQTDVVLCEQAWHRNSLQDGRTCNQIGKQVDARTMDSLARIVLHEMLHHGPIGQKSLRGEHIVDPKPKRDPFTKGIYGPWYIRRLIQTHNAELYLQNFKNADTYAWFAQELYWSRKCGKNGNDVEYIPPVQSGNEMVYMESEELQMEL